MSVPTPESNSPIFMKSQLYRLGMKSANIVFIDLESAQLSGANVEIARRLSYRFVVYSTQGSIFFEFFWGRFFRI